MAENTSPFDDYDPDKAAAANEADEGDFAPGDEMTDPEADIGDNGQDFGDEGVDGPDGDDGNTFETQSSVFPDNDPNPLRTAVENSEKRKPEVEVAKSEQQQLGDAQLFLNQLFSFFAENLGMEGLSDLLGRFDTVTPPFIPGAAPSGPNQYSKSNDYGSPTPDRTYGSGLASVLDKSLDPMAAALAAAKSSGIDLSLQVSDASHGDDVAPSVGGDMSRGRGNNTVGIA